MNIPNAHQIPPVTYLPPKKTFSIVYIILIVFCLLMVLMIVGGIRAFHAVKDNSVQAISISNRFIDSMGKHQYQSADALFTPEVQAHTSVSSLKDMETLVEKHYGTYLNHGQPQWNVQTRNGQTNVQLAYPMQFTKGNSMVSLVLINLNGKYEVYDVHYEL